jgi:hypothetical protein
MEVFLLKEISMRSIYLLASSILTLLEDVCQAAWGLNTAEVLGYEASNLSGPHAERASLPAPSGTKVEFQQATRPARDLLSIPLGTMRT